MTSLRVEPVDDTAVVVTAVVAADPAAVLRAFTEQSELAAWFWPTRLEPRYALDVKPGGTFHVEALAAGFGVHGTYDVIEPRRLTMSWTWDGQSATSEVAIDIAADGESDSVVTLTHSANPSIEQRDQHGVGWRDCLTRLVAWKQAGR